MRTALLLLTLAAAGPLWAENRIPAKLPEFVLPDPLGKFHSQEKLLERGALVILTVPNVKHATPQDRWARWITRQGWDDEKPLLVFIEDISQVALKEINEKAREKLKEQYREGRQPLILLDESGETRRKFGVTNDETVVLLINKKGEIVYSAGKEPTIEKAKEVLAAIEKMKG